MKICLVCDGSYPYITGGVSSWVHMLIQKMPEHEFIIYAIGAFEKSKGDFKYQLPSNVIEVREVFLDSIQKIKTKAKFIDISVKEDQKQVFKQLILGEGVDWQHLIGFMRDLNVKNVMELFMSKQFFEVLTEACEEKFAHLPFTDFFWTMRSMLLPIFYLTRQEMPQADIYHSVSAGYGGIIGAVGHCIYGGPFLLTEHGIYAREREEEIIKAGWVKGHFKDKWIEFFYSLSKCSYDLSSKVVTLFENNKRVEIDLGCDPQKISIIPNGVNIESLEKVQSVRENDGYIHLGTIARVVPIKDIKTMISAFSLVKEEIKNVRLYIMGPTDEDEEYYEECLKMLDYLQLEDVIFTGTVKVADYIGKMDILLLSSISEGQPLAVLEGMACRKPFVTTNVGSCQELLYGRDDDIGQAGIVVPIMDDEKMAEAILALCRNQDMRTKMGENGFLRVNRFYTLDNFINQYKQLYFDLHENKEER